MGRHRRSASLGLLAAAGLLAFAGTASASTASTSWSAYLHGARHSSDAATSSAITVSNAASLHPVWSWTAPPKAGVAAHLDASPVTLNGTVYVNSGTDIYALNETTGAVRWRKLLPAPPCAQRGSTSTPAVVTDPVSKQLTVYVAGGDNYLYALDPATGSTRWRTVNGGADKTYFTWGSPTVARGKVYMALSSSSCTEFSHGGEAVYDQHTGRLLGTYKTATSGEIPTVYSSATTDGTNVYISTGDGDNGDIDSVVRLRATDLRRQEAWQIPNPPVNSDFNASPAFFTRTVGGTAVDMIGVCNKDGNYYALTAGNLAAGPVWTARVGLPSGTQDHALHFCGGSSAYDSSRKILLIGANQSALTDTDLGSTTSLDPQTGAVRWRTRLPAGPVIGSVSVNAASVVAAPTYDGKGGIGKVYLLNESTGKILKVLSASGPVFAQPAFSGNHLLVSAGATLTAYQP